MKRITEKDLRNLVIKLRKRHREIQDQQFFCNEHNFKIEAEFKRQLAEEVQRIAHEIERDFDLGFVWDESLNK